MLRTKRGLFFWIMLFATVVAPLSAVTKKQLYKATINDAFGTHVGNGTMTVVNAGAPSYFIAGVASYTSAVVTKVGLESNDGSWGLDAYGNPKQVVLCENGGIAGDCTYDTTNGRLVIDGTITPTMIGLAGITGGTFMTSLRDEKVKIVFTGPAGEFKGEGTLFLDQSVILP